MLLLLITTSLSKTFPSADDIATQCSICNYIVGKFSRNSSKLLEDPVKDSYCAENQSNRLCLYLKDIINFTKTLEPKKLTNLCKNIKVCPPNKPEEMLGARCQACINAVFHINMYPKKKRETAFYHYCMTSRFSTGFFCGDVADDDLPNFLDDINSIEDPIETCVASHFCRRKNESDRDEV